MESCKMSEDLTMTDSDQKALSQLEESFICEICSEALITATRVDCGHYFCTYCLDLLQSLSPNCPLCNILITSKFQAPEVDQEIVSLIQSCSSALQKKFESTIRIRQEKAKNRMKALEGLNKLLPIGTKPISSRNNNLDALCTSLTLNIPGSIATGEGKVRRLIPRPNSAVSDSGSRLSTNKKPSTKVDFMAKPKPMPKPRSRSTKTAASASSHIQPPPKSVLKCYPELEERDETRNELPKEIDDLLGFVAYDKVESLNELYSDLLKTEDGNGAAGDVDVDPVSAVVRPVRNSHQPDLQDIQALRLKHENDVQLLLKEAEGSVELDKYVQKWSNEIDKVLNGDENEEIRDEIPELHISGFGGKEESFQDDLWETSAELIRQFRSKIDVTKPDEASKGSIVLDTELKDIEEGPIKLSSDSVMNFVETDYDQNLQNLLERIERNRSECGPRKPKTGEKTKFSSTSPKRLVKPTNNRPGTGIVSKGNVKSTVTVPCKQLTNKGIDEDLEFSKKLTKCKKALTDLKNNKLGSSKAIQELLETKECKTGRIPDNDKLQATVGNLSGPKSSRDNGISDGAKARANTTNLHPTVKQTLTKNSASKVSKPATTPLKNNRSQLRPQSGTTITAIKKPK